MLARAGSHRFLLLLLLKLLLLLLSVVISRGASTTDPAADDDPEALFARFDGDGDGSLDQAEYGRMYRDGEAHAVLAGEASPLSAELASEALLDFFDRADTSSDGKLSYTEWEAALLEAIGLEGQEASRHNTQGKKGLALAEEATSAAKAGTGTPGENAEVQSQEEDPGDFAMSFDANRDGFLDLSEFRELMSADGMDGEDEDEEFDEVAEVFARWDATMDQRLSLEEVQHGLNVAAGIVPEIPEEFLRKPQPNEFGTYVDPEVMKQLEEDRMREPLGAEPRELYDVVRSGMMWCAEVCGCTSVNGCMMWCAHRGCCGCRCLA
jgi:Ca2+-binding EF-hand superfamily protein